MSTYLFYPRRADGVSLTFIAEAAETDRQALELASEIAASHDCVGVFVWESAQGPEGRDRFVGEISSAGEGRRADTSVSRGASANA